MLLYWLKDAGTEVTLPHVGNMIVLRLKHWFSVESNVRRQV